MGTEGLLALAAQPGLSFLAECPARPGSTHTLVSGPGHGEMRIQVLLF